MIIFVNKKTIIPIIGIVVIIIGIIAISYQEPEIEKSNDKINVENKTSENPIIDQMVDEKLNEIEKNADENYFKPAPRDWQTSGPFQIDRSNYLVGEKIFLRIGGLNVEDKGQVAFLKQSNATHYTVYQTIPFDGSKKNEFNYYTDIKLSKVLGLCTIDDVIGEWNVVFRGTEYKNLKFEVSEQILPGEEGKFSTPVC
jgi:hypothetical protein